MACNFCKSDLYIKPVQYAKPLLAPLTRVEELRQELLDLRFNEQNEMLRSIQKELDKLNGGD